MSINREDTPKLDMMREKGISTDLADQYILNEKGELLLLSNTPKKTDKDEIVKAVNNLPDDEVYLLKEILLCVKQTEKFNKDFTNKVLITYLQEMQKGVKTIKNWVTFAGVLFVISLIISVLGSCMGF